MDRRLRSSPLVKISDDDRSPTRISAPSESSLIRHQFVNCRRAHQPSRETERVRTHTEEYRGRRPLSVHSIVIGL